MENGLLVKMYDIYTRIFSGAREGCRGTKWGGKGDRHAVVLNNRFGGNGGGYREFFFSTVPRGNFSAARYRYRRPSVRNH